MSATINDPTLQVYLKLDRLSLAEGIKKTTDFSQYNKSAVITGAPILASDDQFANSLQLNGTQDFVEVADPFANETAFTMSIWARPDALNDGDYHGIMGHQGPAGLTPRKPGLWLMPNSKGLHFDSYDATGEHFIGDILDFFEEAAEWVHIAWVKDGVKYLFYRNGILFHQAVAPAQFVRAAALPFHIGRSDVFYWKGRLAHARVYSRALTAEEIGWDMDEDRTAMAAFRTTHPVSFSLNSSGQENVLFIVGDPAKQSLNVTIQNDSRTTIDFEAAEETADAGPDAHHFSLHFRPGALSTTSINGFPNIDLPGWKKGLVRKADGGVILYFLKTTAFSLALGQTVSFDLAGFSADSKGGARNTVVEMHFREKPAYTDNDKLPSRYRTQQISIVNHLGQTHFPVHFGAVGSNTILNDGSTNPAVVFHLANLLPVTDPARPEKAYLRFKGKNNNPTDYSKLILTFDTQLPNTTKEWALCKSDELAGMQPTIAGWVQESLDLNIQSPKWTFRRDTDLDLKSGEFIDIRFTGIKSTLPSGLTRMVLLYENVMGYWDGQLVAPVEKSPIVIRNGNIGIGRAQPEYPIDINADIKLQHNHEVCVDYGPWAWVNEKLISFEVPYKNDPSRGLVHFYAPTNYYENVPALTLAGNYGPGGKVGIGTKAPEDYLQIGDFGHGDDTYMSVKTVGGNKFKAGLKLRHYSEDYGFTLVSDETINSFQIIGHWVNAPSVPALHIGRIGDRDYLVGIGTVNPLRKLEVNNAMRFTNSSADTNDGVLGTATFSNGLNVVGINTDGSFRKISLWGEITQHQNDGKNSWSGINCFSGKVGIRTNNPTKGTLEIAAYEGYSYTMLGGIGTINGNYSAIGGGTGVWGTSVWADGKMAAHAYTVQSDGRIKIIEGRSNQELDLEMLLRIEVTDFKYKDVIGKGNTVHKKVIAQQVEEVFPQAVTRHTNVVPDIYQDAAIREGWIALSTDLKKGEKVKLIADEVEGVFEVLEITPDGFRTDFKPEADKVFVFGREVDDFGIVDYDAISMLHVSATQELHRQLEAQQAKIKFLETAFEQLTAELTALKTQIHAGA